MEAADIINFLQTNFGSYFTLFAVILAFVCTLANVITAAFPSVKTNPVYNGVMKVLNVLAGNVFKNKNADEVLGIKQ